MDKFWGYISIYVAPNYFINMPIFIFVLFVKLTKLNICIDILFGI